MQDLRRENVMPISTGAVPNPFGNLKLAFDDLLEEFCAS